MALAKSAFTAREDRFAASRMTCSFSGSTGRSGSKKRMVRRSPMTFLNSTEFLLIERTLDEFGVAGPQVDRIVAACASHVVSVTPRARKVAYWLRSVAVFGSSFTTSMYRGTA